jgi:hypothetical protein
MPGGANAARFLGDGKINKYDPATGAFLETISRADGTPLVLLLTPP